MKRTKTGKRLLSWVLTLAMVVGLLPGMSLTALAATNTYTNLIPTDSDTDLSAKQVTFNGIKWYIIKDDSTSETTGTVTLLAADKIDQRNYATQSNTIYKDSSVKEYLDGLTAENGSFEAVANAIESTDLIDVDVTGAKLYLLSFDEAKTLPQKIRDIGTQWWLRTNIKIFNVNAEHVGKTGDMTSGAAKVPLSCSSELNSFGVRPVLKLKLDSVNYSDKSFTVPTVAVTNVTLDKTTAQTIDVGGKVSFTATVSPENATDKKVKWSVDGTNAAAVKLYSDADCTTEVGTDATDKLTVYAKSISEGEATVTATSNADSTKTASCAVKVHAHSFTYSASGATITATCTATATDCPLTDEKATLTIGAPTLTYVGQTGDGISAVATLTDLNNIQGGATVRYYKANANGTAKEGEALAAAPTAGGKYWAEITLGTGENTATAHVVYTIANPDYTITLPTGLAGGTVTANKVKAKFNEVVTLTITPESDCCLKTLTVKDANNADVTVKNNQFTMSTSNVTVSAEFAEKKSTGVTLTVNKDNGKGGTASLLKSTFEALGNDTIQSGEKFILCVTPEEEYDFTVAYSTNADREELSEQDYKDYLTYAQTNNITVSLNTVMYWVTMPYVESGNLTATANFIAPTPYTILYQPTANYEAVFCKVSTDQNGDNPKYVMMSSGAKMGNDTVWSLTITSTVRPTKIAFVGANTPANDSETETLMNTLKDAAMSDIPSISTTANWTTNANNDKFCVIGGTAKVVTAVFVSDPKAVTTVKDNTVDAATSDDVSYQFVVCANGSPGTVTAPAPSKEGYDFGGWRGVTGTGTYQSGDEITISDNTTLNAIWNLKTLTVTLDLNGGTGDSTRQTVDYGTALSLSVPTRDGYAFDRWTVGKAVTEDGAYFARGSTFDVKKRITADLKLTAQWKHVHSYKCYKISAFGDKLAKYQKYEDAVHVAICDCKDIQLTAHEFDSSGKCKCGYTKPGTQDVTMNVSYGQWSNNQYTEKMKGMPETAKDGQEVSVCAPGYWGNLEFSKWQYSTDGTKWYDLTADAYASFLIPCSLSVRALYINPVSNPTVELSSRHYDDHAEVGGQNYTMDNILYQMNYKLPDGCTFVDGGIKLGDNSGISYYFIQQVRMSYDNESKGIIAGIGTGVAVASFFTDGLFDAVSNFDEIAGHMNDTGIKYNYLETEENVLEKKLTPATLAQYMYEGKPVNVEKYPPIYWEARVPTKGMSGSITTVPPLRFAQKNNQEHYIYGIAWMRYKDQSGNIQTIYTNAINPTAKDPDARAINPAQ